MALLAGTGPVLLSSPCSLWLGKAAWIGTFTCENCSVMCVSVSVLPPRTQASNTNCYQAGSREGDLGWDSSVSWGPCSVADWARLAGWPWWEQL